VLIGGNEAPSHTNAIASPAASPVLPDSLDAAHRCELEVGDLIEIIGKRAYPQLNGEMGKVLVTTTDGRAHVKILTGEFHGATLKAVGRRKLRPVVLNFE